MSLIDLLWPTKTSKTYDRHVCSRMTKVIDDDMTHLNKLLYDLENANTYSQEKQLIKEITRTKNDIRHTQIEFHRGC